MSNLVGAWCDSHEFTDTDLLEQIAGISADTACGVLTNRNVTGERFSRVLDRANLTAQNVAAARPGFLVTGRSGDEQVELVLAANARSAAAAAALVEVISAEAAWKLWTHLAGTRVKNGRVLTESLVDLAASDAFVAQSDHCDYAAFIDAVRTARGDDRPVLLAAAAAGARTAEELLALTDALAHSDAQYWTHATLDALVAAARSHPAVVAHWAAYGGDVGMLAAAGDHRLDAAVLTGLTPTSRWGISLLWVRLVANVGLAPEQVAGVLERDVAKILADTDLDQKRAKLRNWSAAADLLTCRERHWGTAGGVDEALAWFSNERDVITDATGLVQQVPALLAAEVLHRVTAPVLTARQRQLLVTLRDTRWPQGTLRHAIGGNPQPFAGDHMVVERVRHWPTWRDHAGPVDPSREPVQSSGTLWRNALGFRTDPLLGFRILDSRYLVAQLTTIGDWREFERLSELQHARAEQNTTLREVIDRVHTARPPEAVRRSASAADYAGLLGNALGSI